MISVIFPAYNEEKNVWELHRRLMAGKIREGYDMVVGWRRDRNDPRDQRLLSRLANWLTRRVTGLYLYDYACGIKMFKKEYIQGVWLYGEMHVFLSAILVSRGARITEIPVNHSERKAGLSKHNFMKAIKDIADLLTIKFLYTYASRPLVFFGGWAVASFFVGFLAGGAALTFKIMEIRNFGQTPLPVAATPFVILGFLLFMLGFIMEVLIRIYYDARGEMPYKIREVEVW